MSSASEPLAAALRLLGRRDRSRAELEARLLQKGFAPQQVTAVLERCGELGYLDDRRYAEGRARALLRSGRAVGPRLLADLQARGIARPEAEAALELALEGTDQEQLLRELLERRFPDFQPGSASDRERRRVLDYCLRRGYPSALVYSLIRHER